MHPLVVFIILASPAYGIALQESSKLLEIDRYRGQVVPGNYIVTLKPGFKVADVLADRSGEFYSWGQHAASCVQPSFAGP